MRNLPNFISCFRVAASCILLFLYDKPFSFIALYLLCGISDAADGYIARRFRVQSALGAKLDSIADFVFFGIVFIIILVFTSVENEAYVLVTMLVIALIRLFNLIAIKVKFGQWSMTHTIGNKVTGFLIYVFPLVCVNSPYLFRGCFYLVSAMAALSALEECFLLFASDHYDVNRRSIFMK